MNKRGQFFLVAALVISGILIGLAGVYTQVNSPKEDTAVYDLSSELDYESLQVIDQGVYTDLTQDEINSNVLNLTEYYVNKNPDKDFYIVYGNKDKIVVRHYNSSAVGAVGTSTGGGIKYSEVIQQRTNTEEVYDDSMIAQNVTIRLGNGGVLQFNLYPDQNFVSVIQHRRNNQTYVASSPRG